MTARKLRSALWWIALAGLSSWAEFSPLSVHKEGNGMPLAAMGGRERGMGEAGMAAISFKGFFLPNLSRSAYYDRTSFTATLEIDEDWLHDDASSNHNATINLPTLATFIKTSKLGTIGVYYQQSYQRRFSAGSAGDSSDQEYSAEGGLYLLGVSWAYSPIPMFALGISQNIVLNHDRFIESGFFTDNPQLVNGENLVDTLETNGWGTYPTFSGTLRLPGFDAALSFTPATELEVTRTNRITGIVAGPIADTTRALPMKVAAGAAWRPRARQTLAVDLYYEDWKKSGGVLNPAYKAGFGYELRGADNPYEDYRKRITYRGGLGYNLLYLREVPEFYGTLGLGLPLGPRGHVMDISLKYGHRSFNGDTFFAEDYVKVSATVIGVGTWGQPTRKRR